MARNALKKYSEYDGSFILLATKHAKSIAIAPSFWDKLGANVIEYVVDTDMLGTFSGEVERRGSALECARRKCEWSLRKLGDKVEFALASEGSFGPNPSIPFVPCNHETLYFIDHRNDFHLHLSHLSGTTNYRMQSVSSLAELQQFAEAAQFPSHALILRPSRREIKTPLFKGLNSQTTLEAAFAECLKHSAEDKVWVETDMRAHFNPSRMTVIQTLAENLAARLSTHCPKCNTPGWGILRVQKGLACSWCGAKTEKIKHEIFGCVKCSYEEINELPHNLKKADPKYCQNCNP